MYALYASIISFLGSFFAPEKYRNALRWAAGIFGALFSYEKFIKPNIETIESAMNNAATGDAPDGYSITEADSDITKIVELLALDSAFWSTDILDYVTNDNEPAVVQMFKDQTGARNRFLEKRWMIVRGKSMLTELQDQLGDDEYDTVVQETKKTP